MTDATVLDNGARVDVGRWKRPVAEPELAVWIGRDLAGDRDVDHAREAITALVPAIELADVDPPPENVEEILAGNIFHRGVVLGPPDEKRAGANLTGLAPRIQVGTETMPNPDHLEDVTGHLPEVVAHLDSLLAGHGGGIRAGDVVICGSVISPLALTASTTAVFELTPFPALTVHTI